MRKQQLYITPTAEITKVDESDLIRTSITVKDPDANNPDVDLTVQWK